MVGGVSIGLGPPRSLISLKQCHFNTGIIIRDFHLMDFAYGKSVFEGQWKARTGFTANSPSTFNVLDRFTHHNLVAAQCIPLDIPSICLDNKARYNIDNLPWNKI